MVDGKSIVELLLRSTQVFQCTWSTGISLTTLLMTIASSDNLNCASVTNITGDGIISGLEVQKKSQASRPQASSTARNWQALSARGSSFSDTIVEMYWGLLVSFFIVMLTMYHSDASGRYCPKATNNDEYDSYSIPKRTVLIDNAWPVRTIN